MLQPLRTFCLVIVSFLSFVALGVVTPTASSTLSTPPADCSAFEAFLSTGEFTLDYSASLGAECVTISTTLDFGAGQTITEIADDGTVLDSYAYEITESEGQCALASATENCGAQLIAFNGDNTALTLTANGGTATLTPVAQNTNDWGIWQSYVILDAGLGNNYRAGGLNPDAVHPSFAGADLGAFASTGSTLSLNGGEIKTYKDNSANVCGGNIQYRVYSTGDTPGSFNGVALAFADDLGNGNQKWSKDDAGVDLLSGLTPGDYTLEIYWDADGDTFGGCGSTNYESNNGANYTASFSVFTPVYGCTDPAYTEYNANANTDDSSCEILTRCSAQTLDGHTYSVLEIGDQCWFAENLRTAVYFDGTAIPEVTDNGTWTNLNSGGQSTYDNDPSNLQDYGRLYNWHAVEDNRGLCPTGYSVPDDTDVQTLIDEIGGQGALKLKSTSGWTAGPNGTNDYGFDGRPAGYRATNGGYANLTTLATWWTSSPNLNGGDAHVYSLIDNSDEVYRQYGISRQQGRSIRCVQNILEGCTDPDYIEYDATATSDNGDCATLTVPGCMDSNACNFDDTANQNDGSCTFVTADATDITVELDANGVASVAPSDVYSAFNPASNLIGHWTFEAGQEATDLTGNWGDLNVSAADVVDGQLDLDAGDVFKTTSYTGSVIEEKTLVVWIAIEDLNVTTGSPLAIQATNSDRFDAIVYAESQAGRFMPGSSNWFRTENFNPGFQETETNQLVCMAITYADESGSLKVTGYRNGAEIGNYNKGSLVSWNSSDAQIMFGPRHTHPTNGTAYGEVDMLVEEARIYNRALTPSEIEAITTQSCTIASSAVAPNSFGVAELGDNNAVLTVTDDLGNTDTDNFTVTVQDLIPPVASANDIAIEMTSTSQAVTLEASDVSTSTDNAGIETQTLNKTSFMGCDDVKTHVVTLTVVDYAGNSDYVTFNVTITHPDVDNDGICDDQDNCTDLTANNYNDPANGVCQPCGTAPVFIGVITTSPAQNMTEANGAVSLDITSGSAITLQLTGINGTPDYTASIATEMGMIPAGYYQARVIDAEGCLGVASAPGGSTFAQPSVFYPLIVPYVQCCSGCGVYDSDTDGICDDSDNCINKLATNYADPNNVTCIVNGCTDPAYTEYNASATNDDGSCATLVVEGCTDSDYLEYDASANTDDGSCATLAPTCESPSMDGHSYGVVEIGDQCWFAENLRTTVYADGAAIPEVTGDAAWAGLSTGARCDYANDASNVATYGRLYNWYAATDDSELCPTGWHVPTDGEWTALETYLGANGHSGTEGTALKSTSGWNSGGNGTDDFGFSALPGGLRSSFNGYFLYAGNGGNWWSSSPSIGLAWNRYLDYDNPDIGRSRDEHRAGLSVRCLRDAD